MTVKALEQRAMRFASIGSVGSSFRNMYARKGLVHVCSINNTSMGCVPGTSWSFAGESCEPDVDVGAHAAASA